MGTNDKTPVYEKMALTAVVKHLCAPEEGMRAIRDHELDFGPTAIEQMTDEFPLPEFLKDHGVRQTVYTTPFHGTVLTGHGLEANVQGVVRSFRIPGCPEELWGDLKLTLVRSKETLLFRAEHDFGSADEYNPSLTLVTT